MTTAVKTRKTLFTVKARKAGITIKQVLISEDQAKRWEKLCKENGYEIVK